MAGSLEGLQRELREVAERQLQEQLKIVENCFKLNAAAGGIVESKKSQVSVEVLAEDVTFRGEGNDSLLPTPQPHVLTPEVRHGSPQMQFEILRKESLTDASTSPLQRLSARKTRMSLLAEKSEREHLAFEGMIAPQIEAQQAMSSNQSVEAVRKIPLIGEALLVPLVSWWHSLEEPVRTGPLAAVLFSVSFKALVGIAIFLNLLLVIIMTDRTARNPLSPNYDDLETIENGLLVLFTTEVLLKLIVHRLYFFVNSGALINIADLFIVVTSITSFFLVDSTVLRSLRIIRLSRVVRAARALRLLQMFEDLNSLLESIVACAYTMFWSLVLLAFLLCLFSIFFVQMQASHAQDLVAQNVNATEGAFMQDFKTYFDSVPTSMVTLFATTTGGEDWLRVHALLAQAGETSNALFIFFIVFFTLAVYNIVMSSFMDRVVKASIPSTEEKMRKQMQEEHVFSLTLHELIQDIDEQNEGVLDFDEFMRGFAEQGMLRPFLKLHGLDIKHPKRFYDMVCETSGTQSGMAHEDFVQFCCRLRSPASALDVAMLGYNINYITKHVKRAFMHQSTSKESGSESSFPHSRTKEFSLAEDFQFSEAPLARYLSETQEQDGKVHSKKGTKSKRRLVPKRMSTTTSETSSQRTEQLSKERASFSSFSQEARLGSSSKAHDRQTCNVEELR
eukprot:TRINITY_DN112088_c0_g1_i1.p1 TRINITY_DN112088_c0_g1~~TRINITY_DN112088_c0_g1_i1.p1  ORF type:complete len:691 (+),score=101.13 TRINITY_DN112088_c0_g1_i1:47-2074(+)